MRKSKKKHGIICRILSGIFILFLVAGGIYVWFGGFGTGKSVDTEEFAQYAGQVSEISVPKEASFDEGLSVYIP